MPEFIGWLALFFGLAIALAVVAARGWRWVEAWWEEHGPADPTTPPDTQEQMDKWGN